MGSPQWSKAASVKRFQTSGCVIAAFLQKFAKHLAVVVCLTIVGGATGRFAITEFAIFLMAIAAAALYSIGQALEYRLTPLTPPHPPGLDHDCRAP